MSFKTRKFPDTFVAASLQGIDRYMKAEASHDIRWTGNRITDFHPPNWLVRTCVAALCLAYVLLRVHTPITLYPPAAHDDGLFVALGESLAEGKWLGRYTQFTLMKGPGYPAFLAFANWLGISATFAHALFYCGAAVFFVAVAHRFMRSYWIAGLLLALLLCHPLLTTVNINRVLREQIYPGQALIAFAAIAAALFLVLTRKQRLGFAALAGLFCGWLWLTREEGIWILPAVVLMTGAATLHSFRAGQFRQLCVTLIVTVAVFGATQMTFRAFNWAVYGMFVGVEVKETNFQRALRAIASVRSGNIRPFVSITQETRKQTYAVSPTFASLSRYFEISRDVGWAKISCDTMPITCGEIGSGWYLWALRDAAAADGHYSSPAAASAFFGRVADEINAGCASGALKCSPQIFAEMPPVIWTEVLKKAPSLYRLAFNELLVLHPPLQFNPSWGTEAELAAMLRFLNHPLYTRPTDPPVLDRYSFSGWYYKSGSKWISVTVRPPNGSTADTKIDRNGSPDIQAGAKDPEASQQRFIIHTRCSDNCALELRSEDGETVQKKFSELRPGAIGFALGTGHVHVDSTIVVVDPNSKAWLLDIAAARVREVVLKNYAYVLVPVLMLGALCFLAASLLYWRHALMNVNYVLALCCLVLVVTRMSLVVLIAATSFPAISPSYLWPAHLFLVAGALFSIAAWLQLRSGNIYQCRRTSRHLR